MQLTYTTFTAHLSSALTQKNGLELAYLLSPREEHGKTILKEFRNPTPQSMTYYKGGMDAPWDDIAIHYVLVVNHIARNRPIDAFKEQCSLVSLFFRYFTTDTGWTLPALFSILRDLRDLACDADLQAAQNGQGGTEHMEESARVISRAFSNCVTDRISPYAESRKWGIYYVVGLILKSYFRIKRISLAKNILRAIDANPDIPPLSAYPRSHQVTYRYYIGMLGFLNEDFAKSEQELTLAFYNCHTQARRNQERILTYLIPLRVLRGHLPSRELLNRFPVLDDLYSPFIEAIRKGDIASYDAALERMENRLIQLNLLLTVEKARELCIRSLFRKAWAVQGKGTRISISDFHTALTLSGADVPVEEAECLVANMIFKGLMRGYISHEKQTVVLANTNAFPRVVDRPSPYAMV
ncbi:COP9 signalosome complex subunit 12 [Phanerochaete sordida]|uniref:COP9 signalosome complex subunit 12 n=1 Tax=Phanerochaete sordida TaxID=48140 RepID=A0A9P3FYI9_9APHY|nr:COP9 signalosome complex subunit 12 [Phanerochaete sordida]